MHVCERVNECCGASAAAADPSNAACVQNAYGILKVTLSCPFVLITNVHLSDCFRQWLL